MSSHVEITLEREHRCKVMEKCSTIYIQTLRNQTGWFWHLVENQNTLKERVVANEIVYCPYCGEKLPL